METASDGRVSGQVLADEEELPIGNLEVVLDDGPRQRTDGEGRFAFTAVREGRHVVVLRAEAYRTRVDTISVKPGGGMSASVHMALRADVLSRCSIYRP